LIQPFLANTIFSFNDTMTLSNRIDAEISRATSVENGLSTRITSNTSSITSNTSAISGLDTRVTSNTNSITANSIIINGFEIVTGNETATNINATNVRVNLVTSNIWSGIYTANVIESASNLYYTNTRVYANVLALLPTLAGNNISIAANGRISSSGGGGGAVDLTNVSSNVIPDTDSFYDLGSLNKRWKTLYLANNTIDLGGALISSDGTGIITISSTGAVLPVNSKVTVDGNEKQIALVGNTGAIASVVPFFTQNLGLNTTATNFTFGANPDSYVFTNFFTSTGATLTQSTIAQFYF
jgi:hypothetical protein